MKVIAYLPGGGFVVLGRWSPLDAIRSDLREVRIWPAGERVWGRRPLPRELRIAARPVMIFPLVQIRVLGQLGAFETAVQDLCGGPSPEWLPGWEPVPDYLELRQLAQRVASPAAGQAS
jgi:hypothetical protein